MDGDAPVLAQQLGKRYGTVTALDGLDLEVAPGEVHGFLGPNGAGKSTTIRILLGLARATSGQARVFGMDPWSEAVPLHRRLASVPGDVALWPNLTGGETIDLLARLRGASTRTRAYRTRLKRLCDAFQLDPRRRGRHYSKGNRQKVSLIAALAVPAELYVLDEPTSGLDPLMEAAFREEISRVRHDGAAVLLSSHILSEVEQLCDRVSIIRDGRIVDAGTLSELRHLTRTEVSFSRTGSDRGLDRAGQVPDLGSGPTSPDPGLGESRALQGLAGVSDLRAVGGRVHLMIDSSHVNELLLALARLEVRDLQIAPPTLETLFLHHYADAGAE